MPPQTYKVGSEAKLPLAQRAIALVLRYATIHYRVMYTGTKTFKREAFGSEVSLGAPYGALSWILKISDRVTS